MLKIHSSPLLQVCYLKKDLFCIFLFQNIYIFFAFILHIFSYTADLNIRATVEDIVSARAIEFSHKHYDMRANFSALLQNKYDKT